MFPALLLALLLGQAPDKPPTAGPTADGFRLPNGWTLSPAGKHLVTTDLPLNILPLPGGTRALVATSGFNSHDLLLCDLSGDEPTVLAKHTVRQSWYGLAHDPAGGRVWWSGGGGGGVHSIRLRDDKFEPESTEAADPPKPPAFRSGVAFVAPDTLYTLDINAGTVTRLNPNTGVARTATVGGRPYDVLLAGDSLLVSDWANKRVQVLDPKTLAVTKTVAVGDHPNQMARHPDGRVFVACASSDTVSVLDPATLAVTESIHTALFPLAPAGSTPCALCVGPDGKTLFVANADNNCVAVVDVETPRKSQVRGFIPTGWYPTAVAVTPDGKRLLVGVGKGLQSKPNPRAAKGKKAPKVPAEGTAPPKPLPYPYIGTTLSGALSVVPVPDEAGLKAHTDRVYRNCPYSDAQLTAAPHPVKTAIPTKVGDPSPIKHVIYVIKENRTYDQVFGDLATGPAPKGNGDPSLCMFPRKVTPNHHALAEEFVLLDNLYCNGQVSRDGHPWSTAAYHTDYTARDWHLTYSKRKGVDDDDKGGLQNPPNGYLWDACARAGLSYRSYGEYGKRVSDGQGGKMFEGRVPGLVGHMNPDYGVKKGRHSTTDKVRDTDNVDTFLAEYDRFAKAGTMPRFILMSLGEDHTTGTTPGTFTPQACVASNDLALGRLVDHVSHGPLWKETAIFVIEDDAQNGPDHVDAHRTVGFAISPYTKRRHVDSTHYATVSLIRTIELILGLLPLSQYDAAARPMFDSFTDTADLTPYTHRPAGVDLNAVNRKDAFGAAKSARMDFEEYDKIDDFELNEVLWGAIMGPDAPQPPAVRRALPFRAVRK